MEAWSSRAGGSFDPDESLDGINFDEIPNACVGQATLTPCTQIRDDADAAANEAAAQTECDARAEAFTGSKANARQRAANETDLIRIETPIGTALSHHLDPEQPKLRLLQWKEWDATRLTMKTHRPAYTTRSSGRQCLEQPG